MGFFDDYFNPQQFEVGGGGLPDWLRSIQQQQAGSQSGGTFGGWPDPGQPAMRGLDLPVQPNAPAPAIQPVPSNTNVPPSPADIPSQYLPIGGYLMPQYGAPQVSQSAGTPPDLGDRLGAGFKSWAYTPVGNPFAALANAITGFTSGQFVAGPAPNAQLRPSRQPPPQDTTISTVSPGPWVPPQLNTRMLLRRNMLGKR